MPLTPAALRIDVWHVGQVLSQFGPRTMRATPWTPTERSLVRALALQVRLLTARQVLQGWFAAAADPVPETEAALERVALAGFIESLTLEAHPCLTIDQPLFRWCRGDPHPHDEEWDTIADRSRSRWHAEHEPICVWRATKRAAHVYGAFHDARHVRHSEASHDLLLSQVFVHYRLARPQYAAEWWGEAAFPKLGFEIKGMKDPDAYLIANDGSAYRIVECAGRYEADHLWALHAHCSGQAAAKLSRHFAAAGLGPLAHAAAKPDALLSRLYRDGGTDYELW